MTQKLYRTRDLTRSNDANCSLKTFRKNAANNQKIQTRSKVSSLERNTRSNLIYLMECLICYKQYVGKTQTTLEKRINVQRSDVKCKNEPITADKHFRLHGHEFDRDAKFTIIELVISKRDQSEMANIFNID